MDKQIKGNIPGLSQGNIDAFKALGEFNDSLPSNPIGSLGGNNMVDSSVPLLINRVEGFPKIGMFENLWGILHLALNEKNVLISIGSILTPLQLALQVGSVDFFIQQNTRTNTISIHTELPNLSEEVVLAKLPNTSLADSSVLKTQKKSKLIKLNPVSSQKYNEFFKRDRVKIISDIPSDKLASQLANELDRKIILAPVISRGRSFGFFKIGIHTDDFPALANLINSISVIAKLVGIQAENHILEVQLKNASEDLNNLISNDKAIFHRFRHDVRNPLGGILGMIDVIKSSGSFQSSKLDELSDIEDSGKKILEMVDDFSPNADFESFPPVTETEFRLAEFFSKICKEIKTSYASKKLNFYSQIDPALPGLIRADMAKIKKILSLMCDNAFKYTETGDIKMSVRKNDSVLEFKIEDSGKGINNNLLHKIKELFEQTSTFSGEEIPVILRGTGLMICSKLARAISAKLFVESSESFGSKFTLVHPLIEVAEVNFKGNSKTGKIVGYMGNKKKILVVDDKHSNRLVLLRLLNYSGFEVSDASSGAGAIQMAIDYKPDLIFMDLVMPDMDGFEVTSKIKAIPECSKVKIIAISGSDFNKISQKFTLAGFDDFLPKPFETPRLFEMLQKNLLLKWLTEDKIEGESKPMERDTKLDEKEFLVPGLSELRNLDELTSMGNIRSLLNLLDELKTKNSDLEIFCAKIKKLALSFELNAIRDELKKMSRNRI